MPKREIHLRFWGAVILLCNMGLYPMGFSIITTIEKNAMTVVIHPLSIVTAAPAPLRYVFRSGRKSAALVQV